MTWTTNFFQIWANKKYEVELKNIIKNIDKAQTSLVNVSNCLEYTIEKLLNSKREIDSNLLMSYFNAGVNNEIDTDLLLLLDKKILRQENII